jgi:hypothetical protein
MYSMQRYFGHTSRMKSMGIITPGHYLSCWKAKKFMKLKRSSDIGEEKEDINTM